jgi:ion channel POLLUX/CASTOR
MAPMTPVWGRRLTELRRETRVARPHSKRDTFSYWFDNSMSRGTPALVAWLGVCTATIVVAFAVVLSAFDLGPDDAKHGDFFDRLFASFVHTLDPGTVAGNTGGWPFLLTMLAVTLFGLFVTSALIGVIASGIDVKLRELRRGRSIVLESDHTVILGWSDSVFSTIDELCIANESRRRPAVVILADRDKVEMEDAIRAKVPDLRGTRVVCRTGSPMDLDALALTSHTAARSIIVLAPKESEDPDSEVIKALLALAQSAATGPRVIAEIRHPSNLETARLIGGDRVSLLDVGGTVAKLVVQTARQSGAAAVYHELFDFDGHEIYFSNDHSLSQLTYGEASLGLEDATLIGLISPDGTTSLNTPQQVQVGDSTLILIAQDESTVRLEQLTAEQPAMEQLAARVDEIESASRTLMIGWNDKASVILRELDQYVAPGSEVDVITAYGAPVIPPLDNLKVSVEERCSTTDRATLERYLERGPDQVVVLCYSDHLGTQAADARTLVTLLHTRDIIRQLGATPRIVSELLDDRNRVLAQVTNVDDVIVSGQIVSLITTQLSEDQRLGEVFDQLLRSGGCEIYLRPVDRYVDAASSAVSFATLVAAGARYGESVIGYCLNHEVGMPAREWVRLNPSKSESFQPEPGDRVVVLAEN